MPGRLDRPSDTRAEKNGRQAIYRMTSGNRPPPRTVPCWSGDAATSDPGNSAADDSGVAASQSRHSGPRCPE
jgi:hypothetical protein